MAGIDRISALPEDIKVTILSHLPIADAICTSVLSRSWHHLWTLLPGYTDEMTLAGGPDDIVRWSQITDHFLSSLRGPIRYFNLFVSHYANLPRDLQHFLDLIFQKGGLWILSVNYISDRSVWVRLPYFRSLKELELYWVDISLPDNFNGFEQLTTLHLFYVSISQRDVQLLIERSKKLLSIDCILWPEDGAPPLSVTFNCPLLKCLRFCFCMNAAEPRMISAPCLECAHFSTTTRTKSALLEELVWVGAATLKFMADIAQVSHLSLDYSVLECLSQVDVPHSLRVHFHQLRWLELFGDMLYVDRRMYKVFCSLLRSMPFLEILKLKSLLPMEYLKDMDELDPIPLNEYKKEDGFLCLDQTLRRVAISMIDLMNLEGLMWMMHFFLLNSKALEVINIRYKRDKFKVKPRVLEKLCEVEKASSDAQVVFVNINARG